MIKIWDWESLFPASQDTTKWEGGPMNCRKCGVALPEKAAFCPACGVKQAVSARKPKRRGNGQGTVVKRGKTYTAICTKFIAGKRITFSKGGFATKKEALDYIPNLKPARRAALHPKLPLKSCLNVGSPSIRPAWVKRQCRVMMRRFIGCKRSIFCRLQPFLRTIGRAAWTHARVAAAQKRT